MGRRYRLNKTGSSRPCQGRQRRLAWLHARVRAPRGRAEFLFGNRRWKWLTTTIPANLLGGLSTKANRLEWAKKAIFMLPRPH